MRSSMTQAVKTSAQMAEGVTMLQRELKQLITASQPKLLADMCAVGFDRPRADAALHGDLPGSLSQSYPFQDASFRGSKLTQSGLTPPERIGATPASQEKVREQRADVRFSGSNGGDAAEDLVRRLPLEHVSPDTQADRPVEKLLVFLHGKDNEFGLTIRCFQQGGNLQSIDTRQSSVQHRDVRLLVANNLESSFTMSNLRENFEPSVFAQQLAQPPSAHGALIRNDHADFPLWFR